MNKLCLGCSWRTIELKQFSAKNCNSYQENDEGLNCCLCGGFLCKDCAMLLHPQLVTLQNRLHSDCMPFFNGMQQYAKSGFKHQPSSYQGHCCMISNKRYESREKVELEQRQKKAKRICLLTPNQEKNNSKEVSIGGAMAFPEFLLLVGVDEKSMDVLGLGPENCTNLPARWHYVIDEEDAEQLQSAGCHPKRNMPREWNDIDLFVSVPLPHANPNKAINKVRILFIE